MAHHSFAQKTTKTGINTHAFKSGKYRILFAEAAYSREDIDKKIEKVL